MKLDQAIEEIWLTLLLEPMDENTLGIIEKYLKINCPGNYSIRWKERPEPKNKLWEYVVTIPTSSWQIDFIFDDPEEEMLWWLKWQ
jgi:hypothetical protein